jgi:hypothetical protein
MVYGYYLQNKKLIIRNRINENPEANKDKRKLKSGRVCTNIAPHMLIGILHYLKVPSPHIDHKLSEDKETLICKIINTKGFYSLETTLRTYDVDYLQYIWAWTYCPKRRMCETTEKVLHDQDLIFRIKD